MYTKDQRIKGGIISNIRQNFNCYFRCPCCNEELDDYEISLYDTFQGMKEYCYYEAMQAAYSDMDENTLENLDLDLEE